MHLLLWAERGETVTEFLELVLRHTSSGIAAMAAQAEARGNQLASSCLVRFRARARGKVRVRVCKERGHACPVTDEDTLLQKMEYAHLNLVSEAT